MTGDVIQPTFHHVSLKTARLQEMIDFYATLVGAEVIHQDGVGAWLTNDRANHRIAHAPQQAARRRFAAGGRSTRRFDEAAA